MKLTRLSLAVLAALLCAGLLAACGGGPTKAGYEKEMTKASEDAQKELKKLQEGTPTPEDVDSAQKTMEKTADDVEDIEPPSEVEDLHKDLTKVLRDTAKLMGELKPLLELSDKDPSKLSAEERTQMQEVPEKFAKLQKDMDRITKGYNKKKYKIGFNEETE